jgi:cysteine-rich repeat protein
MMFEKGMAKGLAKVSLLVLAVSLVGFFAVNFVMPAFAVDTPYCTTTGSYQVCTDQEDYSPTFIVHIAGSGFASDSSYLIKVTRPDGSVVTGDGSFGEWPSYYDIAVTDADGNFQFDYILDGIFGNYTIEVLDLENNVLATHNFTDKTSTSTVLNQINSGNALTAGSSYSWSGTVTPNPGTEIVTLYYKGTSGTCPAGASGTSLGTATVSSGAYSGTFTAPVAGSYRFYARFDGNSNYAASDSDPCTSVTVNAPTAVCGNNIVESGEQCDDGNTANGDCCSPTCQYESASTVCRASGGTCDVAETCTGSSAPCPADSKSTAQCRASAGVCDVAEYCDGSSNDCPSDSFLPSTTGCRAAGGVCDVAEFCTGTGAACPADAVRPSDYVCAYESGQCDANDICDGTTKVCNEVYASSGTSCDDGLFCNVDETCNGAGVCTGGTAKDCSGNNLAGIAICDNSPDDIHYTWDSRNPFTSVCDENANVCTTGDSTINHQSPTIGVCGVACLTNDDCNSLDTSCADGVCNMETYTCEQHFKSAGTTCRDANGVCDVAEVCTGSSATCPDDSKSTAECRASAGICDVAESCDGTHNDCPTDTFVTQGTECRTSAGFCDPAEACTGTGALCPDDSKSTAVCRPSAGICDVAESCDGTHDDCPANGYQPAGTACDDLLFCNVGETCNGAGACTGGSARSCSGNNIVGITTCTNPFPDDGISFTWDSRNPFTSVCDEDANICPTGSETITHTCNKATCSAECDQNSDCAPKLDGSSCKYGGTCNTNPASCSCNYAHNVYCPAPGTVVGTGPTAICYYGTQLCSESGCGLSHAAMGNYDTCSPTLGPIDTIPPVTTDTVPSAWQTAPFDVTFVCTDSGSGCSKVYYTTDGTDPTTSSSFVNAASSWKFTMSTDGKYTIKYRGKDVTGNLEDVETAVNQLKIDQTKPIITGAVTTSPNANGWYKTDVTVHFDCTDIGGSGVDSLTSDTTLSGEGVGQHVLGTCTDLAGNSNTYDVTGINIDKTAPSLISVGFTADSVAMPGNLADGYTLLTHNFPAIHHVLQYTGGASETLNSEKFGLYLTGATEEEKTALKAYYDARSELDSLPAFRDYLKDAVDGFKPFAYFDGNTVKLVDAAKYDLLGMTADMDVPDDYPLGTYTVTGEIKDLADNTQTVTFKLIVTGDRVLPVITIVNPDTTPAQSKTITASADKGTLYHSVTTGSVCDGTLTFVAYVDITFTSESDNGKRVCYKADLLPTDNVVSYSLSAPIAGIDTTAPVTTDDAVTGWRGTDTTVTLTPSDTGGSGVANTHYCIYNSGDSPCTPATPGTFVSVTCAADSVCQQIVRYYSTDNAGNVETTHDSAVIQIDKTKPVTTLTIGTPKSGSNPTSVSLATSFTLSATDSGSGVDYKEFKFDSGSWASYTGSFNAPSLGSHTLYYRSVDKAGNVETEKSEGIVVVTFTVLKLLKVPAPSGTPNQYSDPATVSAKLTDLDTGLPISGKTIIFAIGTQSTTAVTGLDGVALTSIILDQPSGPYTVSASFTETGYFGSSDSKSFTINKENVAIAYTGDTFEVTGGAPSMLVTLSAQLTQEADGHEGTIELAKVTFVLASEGGGTSYTFADIGVNSTGGASTTQTISTGVYSIEVKISDGNLYWVANPPGVGTLVVTMSTSSSVTGGGWITDTQSTNNKGNFGFELKYNKNLAPKGNFVYVWRGTDGFDYKVKSTSWQKGAVGLAFISSSTATFSGNCVIQKINPLNGETVQSWGNSKLTVQIEDNDMKLPQSTGTDRISISFVASGTGGPSRTIIMTDIGNGNIVVHSK